MKDFCRLLPCRTAAARAQDFSRIDFGWLGGFGRTRQGYAGPDIYEYVASRAAAWDCPLSLRAALEDLQSNPRADDCLAAIKIWEDARLGNHLTAAKRRLLRNVSPEDASYVTCYEQREVTQRIHLPEKQSAAERRILADRREHHLFINEKGGYELVEVEELAGFAGGRLKVFVFRREGNRNDTFALVWAREGELRCQVASKRLTAMRPFGAVLPAEQMQDTTSVVVGPRMYLALANTALERAKELLRSIKHQ